VRTMGLAHAQHTPSQGQLPKYGVWWFNLIITAPCNTKSKVSGLRIICPKTYWYMQFPQCSIVSSWWQKTYILFSCQLHFTRLFLVKITPRQKYHTNIFIYMGSSSSKFSYYYQLEYQVGLNPCT
jgi:hypothetical protein